MIQSFNEKSVEVTEPLKIMLGWVGNLEPFWNAKCYHNNNRNTFLCIYFFIYLTVSDGLNVQITFNFILFQRNTNFPVWWSIVVSSPHPPANCSQPEVAPGACWVIQWLGCAHVAGLTFYRIIALLILLFVLQTTVDYNLTLQFYT